MSPISYSINFKKAKTFQINKFKLASKRNVLMNIQDNKVVEEIRSFS